MYVPFIHPIPIPIPSIPSIKKIIHYINHKPSTKKIAHQPSTINNYFLQKSI